MITGHFVQRVRERVGPGVDAFDLAARVIDAVQRGDAAVARFVCRLSRDGRRVFQHTLPDGREFFVVVDTEIMRCITVMPPGFEVRPQGRAAKVLRA